jgi:tellurite resistance protein
VELAEHQELLRAAIALSLVDGRISSGEKGFFVRLAERIGVSTQALNALVELAESNPAEREKLFEQSHRNPKLALELLVALARLDGEITHDEREWLVDISTSLDVGPLAFSQVYRSGIARADQMRRQKGY